MGILETSRKGIRFGLVIAGALLTMNGLHASFLWSNGAVNTTANGDQRCDSGINMCGATGGASWTIFDNFNIPNLGPSHYWSVSGIDFTDFLTNGPTTDYTSTSWSIWAGDPLSGGTLVASGTAVATLTPVLGVCGAGSTCVLTFSIDLPDVALASGATYYLGTSNLITPTNANESTERAFAAGGNTAPGGTINPVQQWEQSNGTTNGVHGSQWTAGNTNITFPGPLGVNETATAFDISGVVATPEPGTMALVGISLGLYLVRRRLFPARR